MSELFQPLQLGDHALDHAEPALPERGRAGIETKRRQQLGVVFGAAGGKHVEIAIQSLIWVDAHFDSSAIDDNPKVENFTARDGFLIID
jgi:hypothetical protein